MNRFVVSLSLMLAAVTSPVAAGVEGFTIVNATGAPLTAIEIRRAGTSDWGALPVGAAAGVRIASTFANDDCAFDLRATVARAGPAIWSGVNLCDVRSVTLNRDTSGRTWVDYD